MLHWYAPYPLLSGLEQRLSDAEVVEGTPDDQSIDLWIYDSPDRLLASWIQRKQCAPTTKELVKAYSSLVSLPAGSRLISGWRLEQIDPASLNAWLRGDGEIDAELAAHRQLQPEITPLDGQLVVRILEDFPNVLESYLDLELRAELVGHQPDSTYLERLLHTCTPEALLENWNRLHAEHLSQLQLFNSERDEALAQRDKLANQLKESNDESELTLLQLHEVQEELEHYFLSSRDRANLQTERDTLAAERDTLAAERDTLAAERDTLAAERDRLATQLNESKEEAVLTNLQLHQVQEESNTIVAERERLATQLNESKEEAVLTNLQLNQVQEELERCFLVCREQANLLDRQNHLAQNAIKLASGSTRSSI
ncbi:hypothetical protein [Vulcanococcus sp. Clear-D1]|uniref:hypothetical protein n=1 Tax=Vulcanococcus sp. Clear-D1 TaxID=2766970 RepID=UPI0019C3DAA7|nr:hypothetical protein [Vulcanococcus sp. Clear-D1]MBD1194990.1 hypothetical protein [Vulcanococcus sp. Clear-D1]